MNSDEELFTLPKAPLVPADLNDYKVQHEIHRMIGLLRFTSNEKGGFTARFAPDYNILPELANYFTDRFGETAWSIIDEKRGLKLSRQPGEQVKLTELDTQAVFAGCTDKNNEKDEWEELWKHYHKTINNEDRNNPNLQRQFMPQRYWKYLPEKM